MSKGNSLEIEPVFIEALKPAILIKPSIVRCSPLLINSIADLNNSKSTCFWGASS